MEEIQSIIDVGEKIHIITRRLFKEDVRRHFAGSVVAVSKGQVRAIGYTFMLHSAELHYKRLPDIRIRVFGALDSGYIINIIPNHVEIEDLYYNTNRGIPILADGKGFSLEVSDHHSSS